MYSFHFVPVTTKPTRFPSNNDHQSPSLIDHVWINRIDFSFECFIILSDFTDHCPVFFKIDLPNFKNSLDEKVMIKFREINEPNLSHFETRLLNFNWSSIANDDVNLYVGNFLKTLNDFYNSTFPMKTKYISKKTFCKPWINNNIKK